VEIIWIVSIVVLGYVGFVALAEGLIGYIQPHMDEGVTLTTTDAEGRTSERRLAGAKLEGKLYVASNHWLRGWYNRALAHPSVLVDVDGVRAAYEAVPVEAEERDRIADAYRMGFVLRFICGFAPSKFLRLDPTGRTT
jgi:hypothetical protein